MVAVAIKEYEKQADNRNNQEIKLATRDYRNETTLQGRVSHVYFTNDNFSAGIIGDNKNFLDRDCRFSVHARVTIGEEIILRGKWVNDAKYGWQFKAQSIEYPQPDIATVDGLALYIANNPAFKGIGPAKAQLIAEAFPDNFDSVLRSEPERVQSAAKLTDRQLEILVEQWIERADINAISTWLAGFGLTHNQIKRIAQQYGNRAKQVLENDPYILCDEVDGFGFSRTDDIALKMGILKSHPGRIKACLIHLVEAEAESSGHTYIERKALIKAAVSKLCFDTLDAENLIREQLQSLCEQHRLIDMEVNSNHLIGSDWLVTCEASLIEWFLDSSKAELHPRRVCQFCQDSLEHVINNVMGLNPSDSQLEAIKLALQSRIAVLSGGAGTGKSFTIAAIYKLFTQTKREVGLCAPTGKAAKRMSQLAGAPAETMHRFLKYNPALNKWEYDKDNKLPHDLIIVDEFSMCDVVLAWRLFSAIDFTKTQVLLVGDHNQLPAVGAGNILRDVLTNKILPAHILDTCFRSAGELKQNCNAILQGIVADTTVKRNDGFREWWLFNKLNDPEDVLQAINYLMTESLAEWGFDPIAECQVITPQHDGPIGTKRLNAEIQRIWQRIKYKKELPEVPTDSKSIRTEFHIGDKVMQIKNDYKLEVMNGATGVIIGIDSNTKGDKCLLVKFDDDEVVEIDTTTDQIKNLTLAYASTVHKQQGSEYPCVVSIVHSKHRFMLNRNLFYTAVTRARKTSIILGDAIGIREAKNKTHAVERRTWMSLVGANSNTTQCEAVA